MAVAKGLGIETRGLPDRPALVFLHGFMGAASDWESVWPFLAARYFCVALDLPGHGCSVGLVDSAYTLQGAARLVGEVLDDMQIDRCALVGYSMGGRLALMLALQNPGRWTGVTVVSASPGMEDDRARAARAAADEALATHLESGSFTAFVDDWYRQPLFASLWENMALRETIRMRRLQNSPAELARALRGMGLGAQPSLWDGLGRLEVPVLLVAGESDDKYAGFALRMEGLCRRGRRVIVPAAGHAVHLEAPDAFSRCLMEFLAAPAPL